MSGFFDELKRRKVYRVAIAYIVAGWALAQGLAQVLPLFEVSSSVIRVVIVLLLIGFPVALVLAWVFDVTPQGMESFQDWRSQGYLTHVRHVLSGRRCAQRARNWQSAGR